MNFILVKLNLEIENDSQMTNFCSNSCKISEIRNLQTSEWADGEDSAIIIKRSQNKFRFYFSKLNELCFYILDLFFPLISQ